MNNHQQLPTNTHFYGTYTASPRGRIFREAGLPGVMVDVCCVCFQIVMLWGAFLPPWVIVSRLWAPGGGLLQKLVFKTPPRFQDGGAHSAKKKGAEICLGVDFAGQNNIFSNSGVPRRFKNLAVILSADLTKTPRRPPKYQMSSLNH